MLACVRHRSSIQNSKMHRMHQTANYALLFGALSYSPNGIRYDCLNVAGPKCVCFCLFKQTTKSIITDIFFFWKSNVFYSCGDELFKGIKNWPHIIIINDQCIELPHTLTQNKQNSIRIKRSWVNTRKKKWNPTFVCFHLKMGSI